MIAEEIANKNKVPRTTYEEQLRKAESKILLAKAPQVMMYATMPQRVLEKAPKLLQGS